MDEKSTVIVGMEDQDLQEIRGNMDQTKRDLSSTIQDIREMYSPERIKQDAKERADELGERATEMLHKRTDDLKRMADRIGEKIRSHPIPFAAAGAAGLGISAWALMKRESGGQTYQGEFQGLEEQRAVAGYYAEENPEAVLDYGCESESAEGEETRGKMNQIAQQFGERAQRFGESARERSEQVRANFVKTVKEHPFMIGTATFLLGILTGLVFPSTRSEDRVLEGARESVRQKAREIKEEAKESAQRVVDETKRVAEEEAEKHGLMPH